MAWPMPLSNKRGITLFESVVAITIVSLTAVAALEAVAAELRTAERARRAIEAQALLDMRLDFLNLMSDQELLSLPDSVKKGQFDPPMNEYGWTTTSAADPDQSGVYDITLSILWPGNSYTVNTAQYRRPTTTTVAQ